MGRYGRRIVKHLALLTLVLLCCTGVFAQKTKAMAGKTSKVKVFLVALGDNGANGRKIGCEDSLIAVTRDITPTTAPLSAAIEELLGMPEEFDNNGQALGNYWKGTELRLKSVAMKNGVATIKITGQISVAGICDEPRIEEQIKATAKQFSTVKTVKVTVNGVALAKAIE